jgi:hypothetical protein
MTRLVAPNCDNARLSYSEGRPFVLSIRGTGGTHTQPQLRGWMQARFLRLAVDFVLMTQHPIHHDRYRSKPPK